LIPFENALAFVTVSMPGIALASSEIAPALTLPAVPTDRLPLASVVTSWTVHVPEAAAAGIRNPFCAASHRLFVVSTITAKVREPSAVFTCAPTGIRAELAGVKRENVTGPVDATAGRRVSEKSAIQLSSAEPWLVAARVIWRICTAIHCSHNAIEAQPSASAREIEPTVKSSNAVAAPCATAANCRTKAVKVCNGSTDSVPGFQPSVACQTRR
jgi:hypothetical protein